MKGGVGDQLKQQGDSINKAQSTISDALTKAKQEVGQDSGSAFGSESLAVVARNNMSNPAIGGSRSQLPGKPAPGSQGMSGGK
jgi:hypothetical protein